MASLGGKSLPRRLLIQFAHRYPQVFFLHIFVNIQAGFAFKRPDVRKGVTGGFFFLLPAGGKLLYSLELFVHFRDPAPDRFFLICFSFQHLPDFKEGQADLPQPPDLFQDGELSFLIIVITVFFVDTGGNKQPFLVIKAQGFPSHFSDHGKLTPGIHQSFSFLFFALRTFLRNPRWSGRILYNA